MGIEISGLDDFAAHLEAQLNQVATEGATQLFAQGAAQKAREAGLDSVDAMTLDMTIDGDPDGRIKLDEAEIRRRANEILKSEPDSLDPLT